MSAISIRSFFLKQKEKRLRTDGSTQSAKVAPFADGNEATVSKKAPRRLFSKKKGRALARPQVCSRHRGVRWDLSGCPIVLGIRAACRTVFESEGVRWSNSRPNAWR